MFGCLGFLAAGRQVVGVSYMNEFVPEKNQNLVCTILNVADALVIVF